MNVGFSALPASDNTNISWRLLIVRGVYFWALEGDKLAKYPHWIPGLIQLSIHRTGDLLTARAEFLPQQVLDVANFVAQQIQLAGQTLNFHFRAAIHVKV